VVPEQAVRRERNAVKEEMAGGERGDPVQKAGR